MCNGRAPFRGNQISIDKQINRRDKLTFKDGLSTGYINLVEKLLVVDPEERMPLIEVFEHPWVLQFQKQFNITKKEHHSKILNDDLDSFMKNRKPEKEDDVYREADDIARQIKELQDKIDYKLKAKDGPSTSKGESFEFNTSY